MGCHSVYRHGYPNVFHDFEGRLAEGKALCKHVLEPILQTSRFSIAYGYISPALSRQIVKYQSPDKPSYHRWDAGAACDIALHDTDAAPVETAFWMDENLPVSRVITYSESPFICVGTRREEVLSGDPRRALYENRYEGERKPRYIRYSENPATRRKQKNELRLEHDWRGAGYPTYHGGGIKQSQHIRVGEANMLSDFLFSNEAVREGYANMPEPGADLSMFRAAAELYSTILEDTGALRMSIVRAYESPEWSDSRHTWEDGIYLILVPPFDMDVDYVIDTVSDIPMVEECRAGKNRRVLIRADLP